MLDDRDNCWADRLVHSLTTKSLKQLNAKFKCAWKTSCRRLVCQMARKLEEMVTCCCCRLPHRSWTSSSVFIKKFQSNKCCPCVANNSFNYFHMSILNSPIFPSPEREYFWIVAKREYFELSLKGNTSELLTKRSFLKGYQNGVFLNCFRKSSISELLPKGSISCEKCQSHLSYYSH